MEGPNKAVRVLFNFEYTKEGRNVWMKEGETLNLVKKTNPDWWQVVRKNERKPFYVPAAYVEEVFKDYCGKKLVSTEGCSSQRRKCFPPKRDKISDRNLFKEFPGSENSESEKYSNVEGSFRDYTTMEEHNEKQVYQKLQNEASELGVSNDVEEEMEAVARPGGEEDEEEVVAQRVLNDKHKSWAAEELVSELTQMAIARNETVENDYVNLRVEGSGFVIAAEEEEDHGVNPPLFWHSSGYTKENRHNPMSSSEELDNSDSLGQTNCVAWQSKYSLSSEGDKTDESIQSFHSLGNESVSSRHWRDEVQENGIEPSAYAQVLCGPSHSSDNINICEGRRNTEPRSLGPEVLKLSASLEKLAQQIKFPPEDTAQLENVRSPEKDITIAPPQEYESPVYENLDLLVVNEAKKVRSLERSNSPVSPSFSDVQEEKMLKSLKSKIIQASCISPMNEDKYITELGEPSTCDGKVSSNISTSSLDICDNDSNHYEPVEIPKPAERTCVSAKVKKVCDNESDDGDKLLNSEEIKIGSSVDVKKKIALWNSSAESEDRFDEDGKPKKLSVSPKFRAFRSFGVVKSASESKVCALVNRHGVYFPGSRSGSEEFLDAPVDGSPVSEDASSIDWAQKCCPPISIRVGDSPQLNPEGDNLDASDSGLSNKSDEAILSTHGERAYKKRKTSLTRNRRVESCRRFPLASASASLSVPRPQSPPPPSPGQEAARLLPAGWAEFRTTDGRSFYYHAASGQRRWKPPRRRAPSGSGHQDSRSTSSSPLQADEDREEDADGEPGGGPTSLPPGWRAVMDDGGQICYVHPHQPSKWFSSSDSKGRVYFFEENSEESSWTLPNVVASSPQTHGLTSRELTDEDDYPPKGSTASLASQLAAQLAKYNKAALERASAERDTVSPTLSNNVERNERGDKLSLRATKSRSMVLVDLCDGKDSKSSAVPRNWPQLFDGDMCVLKEGTLNRTKITENGKKLRKNWASSHVVLTELFLLLFRDAKAFQAMKSSASSSTSARPELCVDLNGALIDQVDRGDKASVTSRKNVFLVSTVLGLQVLFQCDCSQQADDWYNAVHTAIHNLPSGFDSCPRIKVTKEMDRLFAEANSPEQTKKFPRIGRSKSVKTSYEVSASYTVKNKDGSIEDLTVSPAERQTKIRARLKKFFNRRPTMESLVKKGIWKDEPAFGCYLEQVCGSESPRVPLFVQRCIAVIESNVDNMKTDGLYRASGNLSQVQKIRLQVDQNNLSALDQEEDVHVLTGALKLFFRELKEPLIPFSAFSKAIKASTNQNKKEKLSQFRDIVKSLPVANHDTLKFLLKHLLRVTSYQEFNRMHIPNLAIVFGPTLMWPEQESLNMALDLMQQNLVIETFLLDFENIFK